ncbi:hypothetical protein CAEBREN_32079 [Caenorhabditis brenneri]|uniref:Uncharacterized protein n=1 Tax=Caenorhabditis brenneri TaxID=135651 RepID=G0PI31_CAEBE|nr:hypothetical protein CAEBREN_32079 [Caenorhabditis brenneri]
MSDNFAGRRKRGGKRERGPPRAANKEEAPLPDITLEEYEQRKMEILTRAVLSENLYVKLRTQLRDNKLNELRDYKSAIETKTCPEYLAGKQEADEVLNKKMDINQARYELKMAQIKDEYEAETDMASRSYDDQYRYAKGRYIDFFKELIAEKERRETDVGSLLGTLLALPPLPNQTTERPIFKDIVDGTYQRAQGRSRKADR